MSVSLSLGSVANGSRTMSRFGLVVALATAFLPLGLTYLLAILVSILDPELPTWMRSRTVFPFLLYGTANVLGLLVLYGHLGGATLRRLGVRLEFSRRTWKVATLGFVLGVFVFAIVNLSLRWLQIPTVRGMPVTLTPITAAALFVSVGLVVPYCEEVLFRSVWYAGLREQTNDLIATILATIAFALIHIPYFGVGGMIFITFWTLIPIRLYAMTGTMTASWLMHVFNNLCAYVVVPLLALQPPGG